MSSSEGKRPGGFVEYATELVSQGREYSYVNNCISFLSSELGLDLHAQHNNSWSCQAKQK